MSDTGNASHQFKNRKAGANCENLEGDVFLCLPSKKMTKPIVRHCRQNRQFKRAFGENVAHHCFQFHSSPIPRVTKENCIKYQGQIHSFGFTDDHLECVYFSRKGSNFEFLQVHFFEKRRTNGTLKW